MPLPHWIAVAITATLPLSVAAQESNAQPYPDDPNLKVPPLVYRSALQDYRPMADEEKTPDKVWRSANEDLRQLGGHAGHVKEAASTPEDDTPSRVKER